MKSVRKPGEYQETTARRIDRAERDKKLLRLAQEAMNDPGFVADMRETIAAFRFAESQIKDADTPR